jgi:hypothetical protein
VTKQEHINQLNIAYARMIGNEATRLGSLLLQMMTYRNKKGSNDDNNSRKTTKTREK